MKIFISHSHRDSEFTSILKNVLTKHEIDVIQLDQDVKIGDNIAASIDKAIREADAYIVVLSKSYLESKWSDLELLIIYGQSYGRRKGKKIFPVLIEKTSKIPTLIRDLAYADLTDKQNRKSRTEQFVINLIQQINNANSTDFKTLKHLLRDKEELLKIQQLEYQLQKNKQLRVRNVFQWSFLIVTLITAITSLIFLTKGFDFKNVLEDYSVEFQNILFYFLGFLTAIVPSLYISIKLKNKKNGQ